MGLLGINLFNILLDIWASMGAQWLSSRVLDAKLRGRMFEPHWRHCVVSLSKAHLSLLSIGSTQEDLSRHRLGLKKLNQTNKNKYGP